MRPAHDDEAETLAHWKPMIIINETVLGPAYVESLVSQSPVLITSKTKGQKTFPLELWCMILDLIANDPDPHRYALVRLIDLKVDDRRNKRLVYVKVKRWLTMGSLQYETEAIAAHGYLARPDLTFEDLPFPFHRI
ncbi:hypothetical protein FLAG1_10387 [Fusarium langsethiae]|uniref:Uncharacterized protein n=1 Tax=Fusarium langsethiae TaxID=179993 RepID=A0A0M9EPA7_FUSLA|nr:hypothetical protein FLAG1_10387 [Fusarium langsethiae]GKU07453.1 unnamed protein product [Fusarium langsethiae]GKU22833.1 unnamed protein product [Fusarium langsethiae]